MKLTKVCLLCGQKCIPCSLMKHFCLQLAIQSVLIYSYEVLVYIAGDLSYVTPYTQS